MYKSKLSRNLLEGGATGVAVEVRQQLAKSTAASRPKELLEKLNERSASAPGGMGFNVHREAYSRGVNVSTFLEMLDPTTGHENTNLDAFERLLKAANIRTHSDVSRGILADEFSVFDNQLGTAQLKHEFLARCYRGATNQTIEQTRMFLSTDYVSNSIMRPTPTRQQIVRPPIQAAIPISALVAITTGVDGDTYRGFYINDDGAASRRMKRIAETADIPRLKLKGREQTIRLYKYGGAIQASYEVLRRMQIDMIAMQVQFIAAQAEVDKVAEALSVIVNGDGNNNAIPVVNLTTLDPTATPGTLTLSAYVGLEMEFENPYALDTIIAQKVPAKQVRLLKTKDANLPIGVLGFNTPRIINRTSDNIALGWTADAPANALVGIDTSVTLERAYEIGATVNEVDQNIENQTELMTFTETEGYAIIDPNGRKMVDLTQ